MPTFYELDSNRASAHEHWWGSKGNPLAFAIAMAAKTLRLRIPMASDDANLDSTVSCVVDSLPPDLLLHFEPLASELSGLGFTDPVYHEMNDPGGQTRFYWATYRHPSGQYCARIHNRYWDRAQKRERALYPLFFTAFSDGSFLVSSSGVPDMAAPDVVEMNRLPRAKVADLWASHLRLVETGGAARAISPIHDRDAIIHATERLHVLQRDYHLQRGVFRTRSVREAENADKFAATIEQVRAEGSPYPEVIAEIARLEEQKPRWSQAVWLLVLSLVVFLAAGAAKWHWEMTLCLIPILFFHELGHWLAMRVFGYRNLRMFFIPLFGAAVMGQNRNVPGWKKAVVALAGPLPGIALGATCSVAALVTGAAWLNKVALLLIVLNALNLLPVLPLDGGRFFQDVLFCRNRWLNVAFQIVAIVGLLLLSVAGWGRFLVYIAIVLALGFPVAFKTSKIIDQFRRQPLPPPSPEQDRISRSTAEPLIAAVKSEFPKAGNRIAAQHVLNIYETLNARPPGVAATAGLFSLYGGAVLISAICLMALIVGRAGGIGDFIRNARSLPRHKVELATVEVWHGGEAGSHAPGARHHVVTTFHKPAEARNGFQQSIPNLPSNATAVLFGDSIIVGLPMGDTAGGQQWFDSFLSQSADTHLLTNNTVSLALSFYAPTTQASTNLEQSLQEFFEAGVTNLVPPWNPAAASTAFAAHLQARRVWHRLNGEMARVWDDPSLADFNRQMLVVAGKHAGTNEVARLAQEQEKFLHKLEGQVSERLAREYTATPYASLVDCHAQLSHCGPTNQTQRAKIHAKVADQLGCFLPGNETSIMGSAIVDRHGLQFRIPFLLLTDPESNLPEILQWLTKQRCSHIRYQFLGFDSTEDESDN